MHPGNHAPQSVISDYFVPERLEYLRQVLNATGQSFYAVDTTGQTTLCNKAFLNTMGFTDEAEAIGQRLHGVIHHSHPDGSPYHADDCPIYRCAATGVAAHVEFELFYTKSGNPIPVTYDVYPLVIDGKLEGATCNFRDTTAEREEKKYLAESELRYRSLFNYLDVGFCTLEIKFDAQGKAIDYRHLEANPAFFKHAGLGEDTLGKWVGDFVPDHEQHWYDVYGRVAKTGEPVHIEYEARGFHRWFEVHAYRPPGMLPDRIAVLFTDVTARKRAEERDEILAAELQHRIKNTMAMIQAIIRQTLRSQPNTRLAQGIIEQRLMALASAQDMLTSNGWVSSDLRSIIEKAIAVHADSRERFKLSGPAVEIESQVAMALALTVHELSTNATKYGALSIPSGSVEIEWTVDPAAPNSDGLIPLSFTWKERNGPPVVPPERRGFGSKLIESSLTNSIIGEAAIDFLPEGVECHIHGFIKDSQTPLKNPILPGPT